VRRTQEKENSHLDAFKSKSLKNPKVKMMYQEFTKNLDAPLVRPLYTPKVKSKEAMQRQRNKRKEQRQKGKRAAAAGTPGGAASSNVCLHPTSKANPSKPVPPTWKQWILQHLGAAPARKKAKTEKQAPLERMLMLEDPHQADTDLDGLLHKAPAASASYEADDEETVSADEIKDIMARVKLGKALRIIAEAETRQLKPNTGTQRPRNFKLHTRTQITIQ
jgi:hypothetical protein